MPIQFDNFDQPKIDLLKNHLTTMANKGKAKFYEIFVDTLKAVPKTDEPSEFDGYEDYMTSDTEQIKICIYNTSSSPRNDQYVFLMKAKNRDEATTIGLNGLPLKTFSKNSLSEWREAQEKKTAEQLQIEELKKEIASLEEKLSEKEENSNELQKQLDEEIGKRNKLGHIHLGEVATYALESVIKRNARAFSDIPVLNGIAEAMSKENKEEEVQENAEVSFKKKSDDNHQEERERVFVQLFNQLNDRFNDNEMVMIIDILDLFNKDKSLLNEVFDFLKDDDGADSNENEQETNH